MSENKKLYYIISIKHTSVADTALSFWCNMCRGYTWNRRHAGLYNEQQVKGLVNSNNIAVLREKVDPLWLDAIDFQDKYVSVPNTKEVLDELALSTELMKPSQQATCRMRFIETANPPRNHESA